MLIGPVTFQTSSSTAADIVLKGNGDHFCSTSRPGIEPTTSQPQGGDTVRPGQPLSWWCSAPSGWLPGCCSTTTITSQPGATPTPTITFASGWRGSGFPGRWSPRTLAKLGVRGLQLEIRALIQPSGWREDNMVEAKGPRGVTHNTGVKESSPVELSGSGGNPTQ